MRRDPSDRPKPGVALPSADNRVPELTDQPVVGHVLSHAFAWLLHGRPAGARRIGKAAPGTFRVWLPWLLPPLVLAIACGLLLATSTPGAFVGALLWLGVLVLGAISALAIAIAAAVARTLPPPRRPQCEEDTLPNGAARPSRPPAEDAPLFEYVKDEVWLVERPLTFYGVEFGTRMTVLRLSDGGLLLHSPVALDPALEASVRQLGEPRCIVAPNPFHHLWASPWREAFPDAALLAGPGLLARRPDLAPALEWPAEPEQLGFDAHDVEIAPFEGHPMHGELAVYHPRSATLVLADMLINLGHPEQALSRSARLLMDLAQMSQRPTPPTDFKLGVDREALARSLEPIHAWKFERIVLAHGKLVERDAREVFRDAFAFVI